MKEAALEENNSPPPPQKICPCMLLSLFFVNNKLICVMQEHTKDESSLEIIS